MSCSSEGRVGRGRLAGAACCTIVALIAAGAMLAQGGGRVAPPNLKPGVVKTARTQVSTGKTGTQRVAADSEQTASTSIGTILTAESL